MKKKRRETPKKERKKKKIKNNENEHKQTRQGERDLTGRTGKIKRNKEEEWKRETRSKRMESTGSIQTEREGEKCRESMLGPKSLVMQYLP